LGITKNMTAPTAVIERVRVLDKWQDVKQGQEVRLPNEARDLAFEFTALSFQDPVSVVLRYRLHGYDKDWRELQPGSPRSVNYTNLPAGSYTFEIKASNNADVWNKAPSKFDFSIAPHFYETGWFFGLLLAMLVGTVYAGYRLQRRAHERQRAELEHLVAERTQQLHVANLALELASQTDPLTGLHNRRYLSNQIPADLAFYERENRRNGGQENTLLFALVDIDHFKKVNDTHGHKAGDRVLQQVSEVLRRQVRVGDYLVRWGGEEFLLVCRPSTRQFVPVLGERIRRAVAEHSFDLGDNVHISLTCSIGLAESGLYLNGQQSVGWEQLVELADAALYWTKENGRNGWAALRPRPNVDFIELIEKLHLGAQIMIDTGRVVLISSKDELSPVHAAALAEADDIPG
jgi:diguanylate cyclase (GGDEF)-like protein